MGIERREREQWLRRQALNIAAQLPDDADTALAVLSRVEMLIEFVKEPEGPPKRPMLRVIQPGDDHLLEMAGGAQQVQGEGP